jgi:hypothetical protein
MRYANGVEDRRLERWEDDDEARNGERIMFYRYPCGDKILREESCYFFFTFRDARRAMVEGAADEWDADGENE